MNWDNRAFILTVVFYITILLFFLFGGFRTPLPLPAEAGILINFGEDETGFGSREPRPVKEIVKQPQSTPQVTRKEADVKEEQLTQDFEDAPAINQTKTKKDIPKENKKEKEVKDTEEKPEEKPVVNQKALYSGRKESSKTTDSEGEAGGAGNQGSLTGDVDATSHSLGAGSGDGISYNLTGRSPLKLEVPKFSTQKEGRVVVRVRVDRSGKVIFAEPGVKGSTTLDKDLLAAAKRAALSSSFNNKADAPMIQEGTITYVFRLSGR